MNEYIDRLARIERKLDALGEAAKTLCEDGYVKNKGAEEWRRALKTLGGAFPNAEVRT